MYNLNWYNRSMLILRWTKLLISMFFIVLIAACGTFPQENNEPQQSQNITLTVYQSPTPTLIHVLNSAQPTETPLPVASPTPLIYQLQDGDTLIGIAIRFGITLDDLRFANPGVDPRFLSIGNELIIPSGQVQDSIDGGLPTPTPALFISTEPKCYDTGNRGAVCFWLMENTYSYPLENISAIIRLFNEEGQQIAQQNTQMLLNVLPSGRTIPLLANFPPPLPDWTQVQAELVTALEVAVDDTRYLSTQVEIAQTEINRISGNISGQIQLSDQSQTASQVWVAVVAYDARGNPVGIRRWESLTPLNGGDGLIFEMSVFSAGAAIDRIEVLVEARP